MRPLRDTHIYNIQYTRIQYYTDIIYVYTVHILLIAVSQPVSKMPPHTVST